MKKSSLLFLGALASVFLLCGRGQAFLFGPHLVPLASHTVLNAVPHPLNLHGVLDHAMIEDDGPVPASVLPDIAQQYAQDVAAKQAHGILDQAPAQVRRVNSILRRLAAQTGNFRHEAPSWPWEIHIETTDDDYASSVAGGKLWISTGMLDGDRMSDNEIAAVIAHEMGHALAEEPISNTPEVRRTQETEADLIGLQLMAMAGYDPHAAIQFLRRSGSPDAPAAGDADYYSAAERAHILTAVLPQVLPTYQAALHRRF